MKLLELVAIEYCGWANPGCIEKKNIKQITEMKIIKGFSTHKKVSFVLGNP